MEYQFLPYPFMFCLFTMTLITGYELVEKLMLILINIIVPLLSYNFLHLPFSSIFRFLTFLGQCFLPAEVVL